MARARAVETRLERQLPAVDEFFTSGFLTQPELRELTRTRTHWEYRLVAKPLLLLDVQNAVKYELALEERLRQYCQQTKVNLKHRWSILERVEYIYNIGVKHLKKREEKELVRKEFVLFLKSFSRIGTLSKLYGQLMISFPTRADIWVEAALWEGIERRNMEHARAILQQALVTMAGEPSVWAAAVKLELEFAGRLMEGVLDEHRVQLRKKRKQQKERGAPAPEEERPLSEVLRAENTGMADLMLGLALAKAVVEEALESPAGGPQLLKQILAVCGEYGFAKEVAVAAIHGTVRRMYDVLVRGRSALSHSAAALLAAAGGSANSKSSDITAAAGRKRGAADAMGTSAPSQLERTRWREGGLSFVLRSYLLAEELCLTEGRVPLRDATTYLDGEAAASAAEEGQERKRRAASPAERQQAATTSLAALLTFAALPAEVRGELGAGQTPQRVWQEVVLDGAARVLQSLAAIASPTAVSRVCLSLLLLPVGALDKKTVGNVMECLVSDAEDASATNSKKKPALTKTERAALETTFLQPAQAHAQELVALADATGEGDVPHHKKAKTSALAREHVDDATMERDGRWPASVLGRFLSMEDRKALADAHAKAAAAVPSGSASVAVAGLTAHATSDDVDELLLWWRAEEKELSEPGSKSSEAAGAIHARLRQAALDFFVRFGLLTSSQAAAADGPQASRKSAKGKKQKAPAIGPTTTAGATDFAARHPLLLLGNGLRFVDTKSTPLCLWRVFNALEVTEGALAETLPAEKTKKLSSSSSSDDSSSDDDDDEEAPCLPPHFTSYAAAGVHFLASALHGQLERQGQLDRAVGLCALVRSRLYSLSGVRASLNNPRVTREDLQSWLAKARGGDKPSRVASMMDLLDMVEQRCQPVPRQCQVSLSIPFLEALALSSRTCATDASSRAAAEAAVKKARAAHEKLMDLYGFTTRLSDFMPVLYHTQGGASATVSHQPPHTDFKASETLVASFNVEDWMSYVLFERGVAQDLDRARSVTERARRACLSPQRLLIKLSNTGS